MSTDSNFSFNISLSVLNHLGRNLYRSFVTVLGEAISNSWDADAENVWIEISKENNSFIIKDDGFGMTGDDFQDKFLKIGYSKRKDGIRKSGKERPFIGRKGIGKLALLSCADKITVISKTKDTPYIGGSIDNAGLDEAIVNDLNANEYTLDAWDTVAFQKHTKGHSQGTIILFEGIHGGIKNTLTFIKKIVALYFRFSLLDKNFNIHIDGELITHEHMREIGAVTQFLWTINDHQDPYLSDCLSFLKETTNLTSELNIKGFVASVEKPSQLKIRETDAKVTVDLFVNGRLREKDILKNIPTNRITESYIYGQLHFDEMDNDGDPFTSSREGVISDNHHYKLLLSDFKNHLFPLILDQWDDLRRKYGSDGDSENTKVPRRQRKSEELFNTVSGDFTPESGDPHKDIVDQWVKELKDDAAFCFSSYAECYVSENVVRKYITEKKIEISPAAQKQIEGYKQAEKDAKSAANLSIDTRRKNNDLSYLSMTELAAMMDKGDRIKENNLFRDSVEYKPLRDALMHTALLSDLAKIRLTLVYENVKGRLKELLSSDS